MISCIKRGPVPPRGYADLHDHVERLDQSGLLYRIDAPINKDTEMHRPLAIPRQHCRERPKGVSLHQRRR
jgi:hypothetical protein